MSFQAAVGGVNEALRARSVLTLAIRASTRAASTIDDQITASRDVERWSNYIAVHRAIALQGAMLMFNTIDLAIKDYTQRQHNNEGWLVAGPFFSQSGRIAKVLPNARSSESNVSLFELVRALCNHFRHRQQWEAARSYSKFQRQSIDRLAMIGISPTGRDAFADAINILGYSTWLDLESDLVEAIKATT